MAGPAATDAAEEEAPHLRKPVKLRVRDVDDNAPVQQAEVEVVAGRSWLKKVKKRRKDFSLIN